MKVKIKDIEELEDYLIADLAWRKKELISLKILVENDRVNEIILLRAAIALLCAHFEGFIKKAANGYVAYVSGQNIKYEELKDTFAAIKMQKEFLECSKSEKNSRHAKLLQKYESLKQQSFRMDYTEDQPIVSTESNPSSKVLNEILSTIGIDSDIFETKTNYIDSSLLYERHRVVHGEKSELEKIDFISTFSIIMKLLDEFQELIIDSAKNKIYLKVV